MKKLSFLYMTLLSLFIAACGGSDDGEPVNSAPTIPRLDFPSKDLICIDNNVTFKWREATDKEGDKITYQIQISELSDFSTVNYDDLTSSLSKKYELPKGKTFYWRVKAIDNREGKSDFTQASRFFTERDAEINQVPNQPTIISPSNNTTFSKSSINIQWQASDPDNDNILYDLYFGTNPENLPLIMKSATQNSYLTNLQPQTKYFWRVIVKDDKGGVTIGNTWNFSTY